MSDENLLADTRQGWLFCLNASLDPETGSKWGYLDNFYSVFEPSVDYDNEIYRVEFEVWGRPIRKDMRLKAGDGVAFYHGKKARRGLASFEKHRHVKPYQLSLIAEIDSVSQNESTGKVEKLALSYSREIFDGMREQPLLLDDARIKAIVDSSGLGKGPTGAFFPISGRQWSRLLQVARSKYQSRRENGNAPHLDDENENKGRKNPGQYVDQFGLGEEEPKKENFEGYRFYRDPAVRRNVLDRAEGHCELCDEIGFKTKAGSIYLETHHIIPLSEGGSDQPRNVIGLCPKHHRQSHYGEDSGKLRELMLRKIKAKPDI